MTPSPLRDYSNEDDLAASVRSEESDLDSLISELSAKVSGENRTDLFSSEESEVSSFVGKQEKDEDDFFKEN